MITVKPVDASPPVLSASAKEGFVQENSPIGTRVLDANAKPIKLSVTDADLVSYIINLLNHLVQENNNYNLLTIIVSILKSLHSQIIRKLFKKNVGIACVYYSVRSLIC